MTKALKLGSMLYSCPQNWVKFINDLETRKAHDDSRGGFTIETINQELSFYGATYYEETPGAEKGRVEFEDESCYSLFVLKYGGE